MCKEGYTGTNLHRYLKNKLSSFTFKCQNCDELTAALPYDKMIEHQLKACPNVKVPCPLRCESIDRSHDPGETSIPKVTLFGRGDELRAHLKENCPNMSVTCARCDSEVPRRSKQSHDCVKVLRGVIAQY